MWIHLKPSRSDGILETQDRAVNADVKHTDSFIHGTEQLVEEQPLSSEKVVARVGKSNQAPASFFAQTARWTDEKKFQPVTDSPIEHNPALSFLGIEVLRGSHPSSQIAPSKSGHKSLLNWEC